MTREDFNSFCVALPTTTHVVQWGGSDVWKVGGKVFAICGWIDGELPGITFKTSPIGYEVLRDMPGLRPAPYLASRGMKWIQRYALPGLSDDELKEHLARSHELVVAGLSRKVRAELQLH
ncbi:MAG: MmcQ/YjbR family DNA-binding protein [Alphaproteobacteria bacterium]|nr:MmcQ/YjbR family DNA-binding protein [Alphaproteobacteria bacterium]